MTNFKTKNLIDITGMFGGCQSLTSIDLSSINSSKVKRMNNLFWGCKSVNHCNF